MNPGWIDPTQFYNTTDPAQSQFFWGQHGYQEGPTFNAQAYNQAEASNTAWGLQQLAQPLTTAQIDDIIAGRPISYPIAPQPINTRVEQYNPASMVTPNNTNVYQLPTLPVAPTANTQVSANTDTDRIMSILGNDVFQRQQTALENNDMTTYWTLQGQMDAILNPTTDPKVIDGWRVKT